MGNSPVNQAQTKIISYNQMDKIRFEDSSLNIYIIGKYNRLMDILIGKKNDIKMILEIKNFYHQKGFKLLKIMKIIN